MTRRRFTEREVVRVLINQGAAIPCFRCKKPFVVEDLVEREHVTERALTGRDLVSEAAFSHKDCHAIVTNGTPATSAGSSKHRIAKAKRSPAKFTVHKSPPGEPRTASPSRWPQGRKLQSCGFDKRPRPFRRRA